MKKEVTKTSFSESVESIDLLERLKEASESLGVTDHQIVSAAIFFFLSRDPSFQLRCLSRLFKHESEVKYLESINE